MGYIVGIFFTVVQILWPSEEETFTISVIKRHLLLDFAHVIWICATRDYKKIN